VFNVGAGNELTNRELTMILLDRFGVDETRIDRVADRLHADRPLAVPRVGLLEEDRADHRVLAQRLDAFAQRQQAVAVEDLTVGGVKLREASMRWTASALTGPWAYDYGTGLLFALGSGGWDDIAAENPAVIPAP
jgi:hypothetical protein